MNSRGLRYHSNDNKHACCEVVRAKAILDEKVVVERFDNMEEIEDMWIHYVHEPHITDIAHVWYLVVEWWVSGKLKEGVRLWGVRVNCQ